MDKQTLINLLEPMDIPKTRRDINKLENVLWLLRNLGINNGKHPNFGHAYSLLKERREELN